MKRMFAVVLMLTAWPAQAEYVSDEAFMNFPDDAKKISVLGAIDAMLATLPELNSRMHAAVVKCLGERPFPEVMVMVHKHFEYVDSWYERPVAAVEVIWGAVDDLCLDDAQY